MDYRRLSLVQLASEFDHHVHKIKTKKNRDCFERIILFSAQNLAQKLMDMSLELEALYEYSGYVRGKTLNDAFIWLVLSRTGKHSCSQGDVMNVHDADLMDLALLIKTRLIDLGIIKNNSLNWGSLKFIIKDSVPHFRYSVMNNEFSFTSEYVMDTYQALTEIWADMEETFNSFFDIWTHVKSVLNFSITEQICRGSEKNRSSDLFNPFNPFTKIFDFERIIDHTIKVY